MSARREAYALKAALAKVGVEARGGARSEKLDDDVSRRVRAFAPWVTGVVPVEKSVDGARVYEDSRHRSISPSAR
jgi:hypothetical protein